MEMMTVNQRLFVYVLPFVYVLFWVVMFFFFEQVISWTLFFIVTAVYLVLDFALRFQLSKGKRDIDKYDGGIDR